MGDLISRQAAIDAADRTDYTGLAVEDVKKVTDEVVKEIKKLPSAQPTQTDTSNTLKALDCVERQAAIDTEGLDEQIKCEMCRNPMHTVRGCDGNCKYDEKLYERIMQILDERIKPLPSAQPYLQQTCNQLATDTIYRQAAIDAFEDTTFTKNEVRRRLLEVPPAQPVHNTGKWVRGTYHGFGIYNWTCKCGHVVVAPVPDRFCGACGCDNAERRTDERS